MILSKMYLPQVGSSHKFDFLSSNKCAKYKLKIFRLFLMLVLVKCIKNKFGLIQTGMVNMYDTT
jgi:hypothetical protein